MRLYQKNVYLKETDTKVLDVCGSAVYLEEDLFFPEGGGQPCDLGTINGFKIASVNEDKEKGLVKITMEDGFKLSKGDPVHCVLDWNRRFRHMQMHAGEHILSGSFYKLMKGENRGFHMDEEHVTIDIWLPGGSILNEAQIKEAELFANKAIWNNTPIRTDYFATIEEARNMPLRKDISASEDISVVTVGDPADPIDCCACCGTHPRLAGEIGLIKVIKAEKNKGMTRLTVKMGEMAFLDLSDRFDVLMDICDSYSTEYGLLKKSLAAQEEKNNAVKKELVALKKMLLDAEAKKLEEALSSGSRHFNTASYDSFTPDDLQRLSLAMEKKYTGVLALFSKPLHTVILTSDGTPACGALVKEYAGMYKGKGGGSPKLARAIFEKDEDAALFLDLIEKHLR